MCLKTVTEHLAPNRRVVTVTKIFSRESTGHLRFLYQFGRVPTDRWLTCKPSERFFDGGKIRSDDGESYFCGFHAYQRERVEPLVGHSVREVKFRDVRVIGIQNDEVVLVAREMFVPSARKRKQKK